MKLRAGRVVTVLALALLAAPLAAEAQQTAGKVYRIGYLGGVPPTTADVARNWQAFVHALRELGYVDGENILLERRYHEGDYERIPRLAAELVQLNVDVIVTIATPETRAAKQATGTIPIIGIVIADPVGAGLAASLARPGGNVTGLATLFPQLAAKGLELLKQTLPGVSRVAVLWNPANPGNVLQMGEVKTAAQALGVRLQSIEVRGRGDFESAFAAMTRERPEALLTLADPFIFTRRTQIVRFAADEQLPAIYTLSSFVTAEGGLMAHGVNIDDLFRRAATYVDKILRGARPGDLPIERPTKFELVINMKTAKALGLTIPPSLLLRADQLIE